MNQHPKTKNQTDRSAPRTLFVEELGAVTGGTRDRSPTTRSNAPFERGGSPE